MILITVRVQGLFCGSVPRAKGEYFDTSLYLQLLEMDGSRLRFKVFAQLKVVSIHSVFLMKRNS